MSETDKKLTIQNKKTPMKIRNKKTTVTRKVKAGTKNVIDEDTGELRKVPHFEVRDVDFNWNKIWLGHLLDCLEVIGNKKIIIMTWFLENRDKKDNMIHATQRMIAKETNVSLPTVTETITIMQEQNVLLKVRNGVYQLNPELIFIGDNPERMDVLLTYKETKTIEHKDQGSENDN
jgi:hypothetical protein